MSKKSTKTETKKQPSKPVTCRSVMGVGWDGDDADGYATHLWLELGDDDCKHARRVAVLRLEINSPVLRQMQEAIREAMRSKDLDALGMSIP